MWYYAPTVTVKGIGMSGTQRKICTKCKSLKNISEFRKDSRLKSKVGATCKTCSTRQAIEWNKNNVEKVKAQGRVWREANREYDTARKMEWAKKHPDSKKLADKKSYERNKQRRLETVGRYRLLNQEAVKTRSKLWRASNPDYIHAKNKERHAAKLQRLPKWLTAEDLRQIQDIYAECRKLSIESGVAHHVDHFYPLQGEKVSGLHVPSNLQIVTAKENLSKKNKYEP